MSGIDEEVSGGFRIGNIWHESATGRPVGEDPTLDAQGNHRHVGGLQRTERDVSRPAQASVIQSPVLKA